MNDIVFYHIFSYEIIFFQFMKPIIDKVVFNPLIWVFHMGVLLML